MIHPFDILKPEYSSWLASMRVTRSGPVDAGVQEILRALPRYIAASQASGVPVLWIATIDLRESDCNPWAGLGQGDSWNRVSTHVPRGQGPFASWAAAAKFYLHYDHIDLAPPAPPGCWTMEYACYEGEGWNGWGPRDHGHRSGYLLSCTNLYDPPTGTAGKYVADGEWSPPTEDVQPGIIPVMKRLVELHPELALPSASAVRADAVASVLPTPLGHGGGDAAHDTTWIQHAMNLHGAEPALSEDGNFGRKTRRAVRDFQTLHHLTADGIVGPYTIAALDVGLT
jgi:lysozyme family protein